MAIVSTDFCFWQILPGRNPQSGCIEWRINVLQGESSAIRSKDRDQMKQVQKADEEKKEAKDELERKYGIWKW